MSLAIGALFLEALTGIVADATIGERVRTIRAERTTKSAFERAIALAHSDFGAKYPDLVASFFDEHFIRNHAIDELKLLLSSSSEPDAERLAHTFAQQFSRPIQGIRQPAAEFIRLLEVRLTAEQSLRDLISFRRVEQTYRSVQRIEQLLTSQQQPQAASYVQLNTTAIDAAFGGASRALLGWPQLSAGRWIERPELETLRDSFHAPEKQPTILIGPPGGGKSALLARLGTDLSREGFALLAIKADQLPAECGSLRHLDDHLRDLGAPGSILDCLQALGSERPFALLM